MVVAGVWSLRQVYRICRGVPRMKTQEKWKNALVSRDQSPQPPAQASNPCNIFADPDGANVAWTTLDVNNPEHVFLLQEIGNEGSTTIDRFIGKTFTAVHMHICRWSLVEEETGEVKEGLRITLIGKSGELLTFAGESSRRCLQRLCSIPCIGHPPWPDGLVLAIGQVTEGKKRRHTLSVPKDHLEQRLKNHAVAKTLRR
jgi:hypothetical protein